MCDQGAMAGVKKRIDCQLGVDSADNNGRC